MKFTMSIAMSQLDQLTGLAATAEECGFSGVHLPDSICFAENLSEPYPYTPDGSRFWGPETPWVDPMVAATAMAAVTTRIGFYTGVLKLGLRNPVLFARQVGSVACLTGGRFGLGVGLGWGPEEFAWCGAPYTQRGKRVDEAIELIRLILGGGMVEYHGEFYDVGPLQMSPAPEGPVPLYIGGHTAPALRRAARVGDGWASAMMRYDELRDTIAELHRLRAEYGRDQEPYEIQGVCVDRFGLDGYRELAEIGVTDIPTIPWLLYGVPADAELSAKQDCLKRFSDEIISQLPR
ncbi:MAG: TIGR03619 family F420-dependent LLM class oxidoreductase [Micromonosporaceae bacterium]